MQHIDPFKNRVRFINHKDARILFQDFSDMKSKEEIITMLRHCNKVSSTQMPGTVLAIFVVTNAFYSPDVIRELIDVAERDAKYIMAEAVIGISPMTRIIFNRIAKITGRNLRACKDVEEAKEWLLAERKRIRGY